jgi:hypothetical protein
MTASGEEKRKFIRIGYDMPLEFSVTVMDFGDPQMVDFTGLGVDISDQGLGFLTAFDLEPGLFISLKREDGSLQNAEVKWVGELDGMLRVGVLIYNE